MSLATNIINLATRMATETKSLRTLINGNQQSLTALKTTNKTHLVGALNELFDALQGAGVKIDDEAVSLVKVWSSNKTRAEIDLAVAGLVSAAPEALDTLKELGAALGNDPNFATTITNLIAAKAPTDSPTFTGTVTVPNNAFGINKVSGLQSALDGKVNLFVDPNADRILFWDDSANEVAPLSVSGLTITGTSMSVNPASETSTGVVERATLAEVTTGTDSSRYVTPQGVRQEINTRAPLTHTHTASQISDFAATAAASVPSASETVAGKVELATIVEVTTGTDETRAVTPAGLKTVADGKANATHGHSLTDANITGILPLAQIPTGTSGTTVALGNHTHSSSSISDFGTAVDGRINSLVPAATTTATGKIRLATEAEVIAGGDTSKAVTSATLRAVMGDPETNFVAVFEEALV